MAAVTEPEPVSPVTLQDIPPQSVDRDVPQVFDVVKTDRTGPPDKTHNFLVRKVDDASPRKESPICSIQTKGSDICKEHPMSFITTEGADLPWKPPIFFINTDGTDFCKEPLIPSIQGEGLSLPWEPPISSVKTEYADLPGEPQIPSIMTEGCHIQNESQLCYVNTEGRELQDVPPGPSVPTESVRLPYMPPVCSFVKTAVGDDSQVCYVVKTEVGDDSQVCFFLKTEVGDDSQVCSVVKTEVGDDSQVCSVVKTEVGDDSQVCSVVKTEVGDDSQVCSIVKRDVEDDSQVFYANVKPKPLVCSIQTDNVNIQNETQLPAIMKTEVVCFPDIPHITEVGSAIESDTSSAPQKTANLTATGLYVNVSNSIGSRLLDTSTPMREINESVNQPTEVCLGFEGGSVQTNSLTRTFVAEAETPQPPNRGGVTEVTGRLWYKDPKYQPVVELERLPCVEAIALRTQNGVINLVDIPVHHQVKRQLLKSKLLRHVRMIASTWRQNTELQQKGKVNSSQILRSMLLSPICENPTKCPHAVETGGNNHDRNGVINSMDIPVHHQVQRSSSCDGTHYENSRRPGSEKTTTTPVKSQSLRMTASTGRQYTEQQQNGNVNSSQNLRTMLPFPICENPFALGTHQNNVVESNHTKRPQSVETIENDYTCVSCQKTFTSQYNWKLHQQFHSDLDSIKTHFFNHTGEKIYTCDICHKGFIDLKQLKKHTYTHAPENPYMCNICNENFKTTSELMVHRFRHTVDKTFRCDICQKGFKRMLHLKQHVLTHAGEKTYTCNLCQKGFKRMLHLKQHMVTHGGEKSYACNICQKGFKRMQHLKQHVVTHGGEKTYTCNICQESFSTKYVLKSHQFKHTGTKPFACNICHKRFTHKQNLKYHQLTHSGEKPHTCDICQKSFKRKATLLEHKLTHTAGKPHTCNICGKAFKCSSSLKRHQRINC